MTTLATIEGGTAPVFSATLTPHRSLKGKGFMALMLVVAALCTGIGLVFLSMGAWPVFGFLGLDVLLVYLAFRYNYRAARTFETIHMTAARIDIRHVEPGGADRAFNLNPAWTRLDVERNEDGVSRVILRSGDRAVAVGDFLPPVEKESLSAALRGALRGASTFHH